MPSEVEANVILGSVNGEYFDACPNACQLSAGRNASVIQCFGLINVIGALAKEIDFLTRHPVNFAHN